MYDITEATPTLTKTSQAFSVSEVNTIIADLLESGLPGFIWVEGEISNFSAATSGHRYLSLKDGGSTISCALFRGAAARIPNDILRNLKNGDKVVVKANLSVYKPRGNYQLIINDIEPAGFGALAKAFTELKTKLVNAGLTASHRKLPLPSWPRGIAVVTSETGAAIQDVLSTLARRAPFIPVTVYPTLVQGEAAPDNIVRALTKAIDNELVDVILLVRGGGSLEDLMAFNDEQVAMAVVNSKTPIVTGVGHETDFTIVDFVSDYRAATPTGAAEIISPDSRSLNVALLRLKERLHFSTLSYIKERQQFVLALRERLTAQHPLRQLQQQSQRLDELTSRLQRGGSQNLQKHQTKLSYFQQQLFNNSPQQRLESSYEELDKIQERLTKAILECVDSKKQNINQTQIKLTKIKSRHLNCEQQLKGLEARLILLSPLGVLERGYNLTFDGDGNVVSSVHQSKKGDKISIRMSDGILEAVVTGDKTSFE